ncbi:MAG: PilN domain-containing protein [Candidatus Electrothrix sp. YB6]
MIRINLLPIRQMKKKARATRQLVAGGVVLAAVVAVLVLLSLFLIGKVSKLDADIATLTVRKNELEDVLKDIKKLEEKKALVEKQIAIVKKLKKESVLTVRLLDEVASITPHERMWLTSLDQGGSDLKLNGIALDNRTIAKYLEELKESEYISDVTLASSSQTNYAGRKLKSFSLSCSVGLPGSAEEESSKETGK